MNSFVTDYTCHVGTSLTHISSSVCMSSGTVRMSVACNRNFVVVTKYIGAAH